MSHASEAEKIEQGCMQRLSPNFCIDCLQSQRGQDSFSSSLAHPTSLLPRGMVTCGSACHTHYVPVTHAS